MTMYEGIIKFSIMVFEIAKFVCIPCLVTAVLFKIPKFEQLMLRFSGCDYEDVEDVEYDEV